MGVISVVIERSGIMATSPQKRRVVVTGIGLVTPIGNTREENWQALMAGRSGAGPITRFDASGYEVRFAAEVKNFDPRQFFDARELKRTAPYIQYAVAAADEALADSRLDLTRIDRQRCGVYVSSGIGGSTSSNVSMPACLTKARATCRRTS